MALLTRLTRLLRADLHALLDQAEEPALLLRHAVREMDDTVAEASRMFDADRERRAAMACRRNELSAGLEPITEQLDLSLAAGNDALARMLLRRRLEGERLAAHLDRQLARLDEALLAAQQRLETQRQQLERLRQRADAHAPDPAAMPPAPSWSGEAFSVSDADIELALLRERQRRT